MGAIGRVYSSCEVGSSWQQQQLQRREQQQMHGTGPATAAKTAAWQQEHLRWQQMLAEVAGQDDSVAGKATSSSSSRDGCVCN
jgi:hypothetical protein